MSSFPFKSLLILALREMDQSIIKRLQLDISGYLNVADRLNITIDSIEDFKRKFVYFKNNVQDMGLDKKEVNLLYTFDTIIEEKLIQVIEKYLL